MMALDNNNSRHPAARTTRDDGAMTPLRCDFEADGPITVGWLVGTLGPALAPVTRTALVKALADQPDALVVDLSRLTCPDLRILLMFGRLAQRATLWPGIPVILSVPDATVRAALTGAGVDQMVAVCTDLDEAILLARAAPVPDRLREVMQPVSGAARRGRDLATEACLRWHSPELVPPASIVTSELVANAVCHAHTPFELSLVRTVQYLHIGVRDEDPRPAVRRNTDTLAAAGRGLRIVHQTALSWGSTPARHGKVVWATLSAR